MDKEITIKDIPDWFVKKLPPFPHKAGGSRFSDQELDDLVIALWKAHCAVCKSDCQAYKMVMHIFGEEEGERQDGHV